MQALRRLWCRWFGHKYGPWKDILDWGWAEKRVCKTCGRTQSLPITEHVNCRCVVPKG